MTSRLHQKCKNVAAYEKQVAIANQDCSYMAACIAFLSTMSAVCCFLDIDCYLVYLHSYGHLFLISNFFDMFLLFAMVISYRS